MSWADYNEMSKFVSKYSGACDDLKKLGFDAYIHVGRGGGATLVVKKVLYTSKGTGVSDPK